MDTKEIERLAASLKPSGTIERGELSSVEQRGPGISLRTQLKNQDIIKQTVELPGISFSYNASTDTIEIMFNGTPATPEQRIEALQTVTHFLRHIQSRDNLTQNLLRKAETQLANMSMDDSERTVMNTDANAMRSRSLNQQDDSDATIISASPQFAMMEKTSIQPIQFDKAELERLKKIEKRHLPLPLWSLVALACLFLVAALVVIIKIW